MKNVEEGRRLALKTSHEPKYMEINEDAKSSFSCGMRIERDGATMLVIYGTACMNGHRNVPPPGDFRRQTWQTLRNITVVLEAEGAAWRNVVRTTCFTRDMNRDYGECREVQNQFYKEIGLDKLPARTGIQTGLHRKDLLVEIEAVAVLPDDLG